MYAGGITGCKRIANFAALYRIPVALHNVGHLTNTLAAAHFGCSVQNFYRSESRLGEGDRPVEQQAAGEKPRVEKGRLHVPEAAGFGVEWNGDYFAGISPKASRGGSTEIKRSVLRRGLLKTALTCRAIFVRANDQGLQLLACYSKAT